MDNIRFEFIYNVKEGAGVSTITTTTGRLMESVSMQLGADDCSLLNETISDALQIIQKKHEREDSDAEQDGNSVD